MTRVIYIPCMSWELRKRQIFLIKYFIKIIHSGREETLDCKLHWYPKIYEHVILFAGSTFWVSNPICNLQKEKLCLSSIVLSLKIQDMIHFLRFVFPNINSPSYARVLKTQVSIFRNNQILFLLH